MKITPNNILKGIRYLKNYGWKEFGIRLREKSEPEEISYKDWYQKHCVTTQQLEGQRKQAEKWKCAPLISILVPVYHTPELFLRQMIASVQAQSYENWELCIADAAGENREQYAYIEELILEYQKKDARIRYLQLERNYGIAENTNKALSMAQGTYLALLDHDDLLAPDALYEVARVIRDKSADFIYTDEDKVTEDLSEHYAPHFKPDFNLDLLRSNNYITHLTVVSRELAEKIGGFRNEYNGAQDYDFILRCVELAECIVHIPKVLYHWRMHKDSTAANATGKMYAFDAGARAIEAHLQRMGVKGTVEAFGEKEKLGFYRVHYDLLDRPLVSIIIPNKDEQESLDKCLRSIAKSSYDNYEVIIVENNSTEERTFSYYKEITNADHPKNRTGELPQHIKVVTWEAGQGFNYSAINNYGAGFAKGEYLILLNNDIELITEDWMEEMLGHCMRPEVAVVGARLYYPDDSIQHAGIAVGVGGHVRGVATNLFVGMRRIQEGYLHRAAIQMDYSAVTAACMMLRRTVFEEAGGFTEKLSVAFNDVDLCLKIRKLGYLIVYDPYVEAYHYESKSRGQEDSEEKIRRFQSEIEYMRTEWNEILRYGDPYYNPNFSRVKNDYSLNGID